MLSIPSQSLSFHCHTYSPGQRTMTDDETTKLNFNRVKDFRGREKEFETITDAALLVSNDSSQLPIVFIHGQAGTGKMALVERFRQSVESKPFYFIGGKYEQQNGGGGGVPYYAITSALNDLCDQIIESKQIQEALRKEMGPADVQVLARLLPKAARLCNDATALHSQNSTSLMVVLDESSNQSARSIGSASHVSSGLQGNSLSRQHSSVRSGRSGNATPALKPVQIQIVVRKFLRTICTSSVTRRIVFFQDDLQWADKASLELLASLLLNSQDAKSGMLFIGTYRDEECYPDGLLKAFVEYQAKYNDNVIDVHLQNLCIDMVDTYLSLLLRLETYEVHSLTIVVHEKTLGNVFFMVQFLEFLQSKAYLYYHLNSLKWKWNAPKIQRETNISANVVDLVLDKIRALPKNAQSVLQIASYLGSRFESSTLAVCMATLDSTGPRTKIHDALEPLDREVHQQRKADIEFILDEAVALGLVEVRRGDETGKYKFTHDRIQQATLTLIPEGHSRNTIHLCIGVSILRMNLPPSERPRQLLLAVNQLNLAKDLLLDQREKMKLAELNREAADLVISQSAFFPALDYLNVASKQLEGMEKWGGDLYNFSLELYNELATIAFAIGDFSLCKQVVDDVKANAKTYVEQAHINKTWVEALIASGKIDEAFKFGLKALAKLGCRFPRRPNMLHVVISLMNTKRMLRGKNNEELLPTHRNSDLNRIEAMNIMGKMAEAAYLSGRIECYILMTFRSLRWSLRHGGNISSIAGYCGTGIIFAIMNDYKQAVLMGEVSLKLAELYHPNKLDPRTSFLVHFFLLHWRRPLHEGIDPILRAHEAAVDAGEMKDAAACCTTYLAIYWCCGLPLGPLMQDMAKYCQQMVDYNQTFNYTILTPYKQMVANLLGLSDDPAHLEGQHMKLDLLVKDAEAQRNTSALNSVYKTRLILAYHFGDLNVAHEMSMKLRGKVLEAEATSVHLPEITFFQGLTGLALLRSTGQRKHKREGDTAMKRLKRWTKDGAVNCLHYQMILAAETLAVNKKSKEDEVRAAFDLAIRVCARSGFLQDRALASERAGMYHITVGNDEQARFYVVQAMELYNEWGAVAKVAQLKRSHQAYISPDLCVPPMLMDDTATLSSSNSKRLSTHVRGRTRYSDTTVLKHRSESFEEIFSDLSV